MDAKQPSQSLVWIRSEAARLKGFLKRFVPDPKETRVLLGLVVLCFLLGKTRPVYHASLTMWDAIVSATSSSPPLGADDIRLVMITADDYRNMFNSESPLNKNGLAVLIAAAIKRDARRVFVDISTEDERFRDITDRVACNLQNSNRTLCLSDAPDKERDLQSEEPDLKRVREKVVWARGYAPDSTGNLHALPVLGGFEQSGDVIAPVVLRADSDGRVRRLPTRLPGVEPLWEKAADALVDSTGREKENQEPEEIQPRFVRALWPGVLKEITAVQMMQAEPPQDSQPKSGKPVPCPNCVAGKVVFLGGAYSAEDSFYMADGLKHPGVAVLAAGALALKNGDLLHEVPWYGEIFIELGLGLIIMSVNHKKRLLAGQKLLWVLLVLPLFCVLAVLLSLRIHFVLDLGALLVAILLKQAIEGTLGSHSAGHPVKAAAVSNGGSK